ncbi:MAG: hemolysin III [Parcubacteria group bacterium Greene0416_79]|nr:MAG: hemolysin III [Parcubacteria group bacterium Greene0416_79]
MVPEADEAYGDKEIIRSGYFLFFVLSFLPGSLVKWYNCGLQNRGRGFDSLSSRMESHRSNDVVSGALHLAGAVGAIAVLAVLIVFAALRGGVWHTVGYALYGSGLILLYAVSASYHFVPPQRMRLKAWFRRLDHAMIFILIAATYTPVTFIALPMGWRWSIFGVIWGLAFLGCALKMRRTETIPRFLSPILYLAMGWLILLALQPLRASMSVGELWLLIAGGISYTLGVAFFALDRVLPQQKYFWMHEMFHVFVLSGSALHTILMFRLL